MNPLCQLSAVEIADAVQQRKVSPVEMVRAALEQLERVDPTVRAIITRCDDLALSAARDLERRQMSGDQLGPLAGVPLTVKDLHLTAGVRTTFGSRLFADFVPPYDCPLVARLRAAGAIVIGKTNTSEFGLLPLATNAVHGESHNPWNSVYDTGGSSGGAAAAVACGVGPIATGSDGGGSIRVPAAWCGVFGLKPQFGRIPRAFHIRGWESLAHDGVLSRTVRDTARALDVACGYDPVDRWSIPRPTESFEAACTADARGLRIAWCGRLGSLPVDDDVLETSRQAALRCQDLGCHVEELELDLPDLSRAQQVMVLCETAAAMRERRAEWAAVIHAPMARMLDKADLVTTAELIEAHAAREDYWARLRGVFQNYDVLAAPVTSVPGALSGTLGPREIGGAPARALAWLAFCVPANMTGQPAASVPAGFTRDGLPVGLQLLARPHDERTLLRLASACEAAWRWTDCWPAVAV